ncbi:MAG: tetratricopeptide repeat protein [Myxococcales bacterium]
MTWSLLLLAALAQTPNVRAEAKRLSRRSLVEYDGGDFAKAMADAKRAYDLAPIPDLLFNLAQCHRALHHWEQAAFFYRRYLAERPGSARKVVVRQLIQEMDENRREELAAQKTGRAQPVAPAAAPQQAAGSPAAATAPAAQPVPAAAVEPASPEAPAAAVTAAPRRRHVPASAWVLIAGGLAVGLGGGLLWGLAAGDRAGYTGAPGPQPVTNSQLQSSNTFAVTGDILVPLGAVLLAVGSGLAIFASPPGS